MAGPPVHLGSESLPLGAWHPAPGAWTPSASLFPTCLFFSTHYAGPAGLSLIDLIIRNPTLQSARHTAGRIFHRASQLFGKVLL